MAQTLVENFAQAKLDLLDYVNRPPDEKVGGINGDLTMLDIAGREINKAVRWANRRYNWKYTEKVVTFTYPSGCNFIRLSQVCTHTVLGVKSADLVTAQGKLFGSPIRVTSFADLEQERFAHDEESSFDHHQDLDLSQVERSQESFTTWVSQNYRHYLYCMGEELGLFPVPKSNTIVRLYFNALLKPLLSDGDTNFFLTIGWDWTQSRAAHRLGIYLKEDTRFGVTDAQMTDEWESMINWDEQIKYNRPIDFR